MTVRASPASRQWVEFGEDAAPDFDLVISGLDASSAGPMFEAVRPLISSVTFEDDEEMSSLFTLTVINQPDTAPGRPVDWRAVMDSKAFSEGNYVDLYLGYGALRQYVDRAEIVRWLPRFPETGPAEFEVRGFDGRHRLTKDGQIHQRPAGKGSRKKLRRCFSGMSDEAIVTKIAKHYGFGADCDPTGGGRVPTVTRQQAAINWRKTGGQLPPFLPSVAVRQITVPQPSRARVKVRKTAGAWGPALPKVTLVPPGRVYPTRVKGPDDSDWQFLRKLAQINRFDLWVDWDLQAKQWVIHFKRRPEIGSGGYRFEYGPDGEGSLLEAFPEFTVTDQSTEVEVLTFDTKARRIERTVISETRAGEDVRLGGPRTGPGHFTAKKELAAGACVRFAAFGRSFEAFRDKPFPSKKAAGEFATNWLKERERDLVTVTGKVIGTPDLRARQVHQLVGMSARLDGLYRFTNVKHEMAPGKLYRCSFTAHRLLSQDLAQAPQARRARTIAVSGVVQRAASAVFTQFSGGV